MVYKPIPWIRHRVESRNPLLAHDFGGIAGRIRMKGRAPSPLRLWLSSLFESPHPNTTMSPDRATAI